MFLDKTQLNEGCLLDKLAIDHQRLSFECIHLRLLWFPIDEEVLVCQWEFDPNCKSKRILGSHLNL